MTALELRRALAREMQELFQHDRFPQLSFDPNDIDLEPPEEIEEIVKMVPIRISEQHLPMLSSSGNHLLYPYLLVRLESGQMEDVNSNYEISISFQIGIQDIGEENNGSTLVSLIIQRIYERFYKNPICGDFFYAKGDFNWMLDDGNEWPCFYGAMVMTWIIKRIQREDEFI